MKMDKKSLNRLLDKLSRGGFLKNIIVKLKCDKLVKLVRFVVHPSINFGKLLIECQRFLHFCLSNCLSLLLLFPLIIQML